MNYNGNIDELAARIDEMDPVESNNFDPTGNENVININLNPEISEDLRELLDSVRVAEENVINEENLENEQEQESVINEKNIENEKDKIEILSRIAAYDPDHYTLEMQNDLTSAIDKGLLRIDNVKDYLQGKLDKNFKRVSEKVDYIDQVKNLIIDNKFSRKIKVSKRNSQKLSFRLRRAKKIIDKVEDVLEDHPSSSLDITVESMQKLEKNLQKADLILSKATRKTSNNQLVQKLKNKRERLIPMIRIWAFYLADSHLYLDTERMKQLDNLIEEIPSGFSHLKEYAIKHKNRLLKDKVVKNLSADLNRLCEFKKNLSIKEATRNLTEYEVIQYTDMYNKINSTFNYIKVNNLILQEENLLLQKFNRLEDPSQLREKFNYSKKKRYINNRVEEVEKKVKEALDELIIICKSLNLNSKDTIRNIYEKTSILCGYLESYSTFLSIANIGVDYKKFRNDINNLLKDTFISITDDFHVDFIDDAKDDYIRIVSLDPKTQEFEQAFEQFKEQYDAIPDDLLTDEEKNTLGELYTELENLKLENQSNFDDKSEIQDLKRLLYSFYLENGENDIIKSVIESKLEDLSAEHNVEVDKIKDEFTILNMIGVLSASIKSLESAEIDENSVQDMVKWINHSFTDLERMQFFMEGRKEEYIYINATYIKNKREDLQKRYYDIRNANQHEEVRSEDEKSSNEYEEQQYMDRVPQYIENLRKIKNDLLSKILNNKPIQNALSNVYQFKYQFIDKYKDQFTHQEMKMLDMGPNSESSDYTKITTCIDLLSKYYHNIFLIDEKLNKNFNQENIEELANNLKEFENEYESLHITHLLDSNDYRELCKISSLASSRLQMYSELQNNASQNKKVEEKQDEVTAPKKEAQQLLSEAKDLIKKCLKTVVNKDDISYIENLVTKINGDERWYYLDEKEKDKFDRIMNLIWTIGYYYDYILDIEEIKKGTSLLDRSTLESLNSYSDRFEEAIKQNNDILDDDNLLTVKSILFSVHSNLQTLSKMLEESENKIENEKGKELAENEHLKPSELNQIHNETDDKKAPSPAKENTLDSTYNQVSEVEEENQNAQSLQNQLKQEQTKEEVKTNSDGWDTLGNYGSLKNEQTETRQFSSLEEELQYYKSKVEELQKQKEGNTEENKRGEDYLDQLLENTLKDNNQNISPVTIGTYDVPIQEKELPKSQIEESSTKKTIAKLNLKQLFERFNSAITHNNLDEFKKAVTLYEQNKGNFTKDQQERMEKIINQFNISNHGKDNLNVETGYKRR